MDAQDVVKARDTLGRLWNMGRPLSRPELGRALGLSPTNGGDQVAKIETGKSAISGSIRLILEMYLGVGMSKPVTPPDHLQIFKRVSALEVSPETGEADESRGGMMRIVPEQPPNSVDTVEAARILGLKPNSLRTMRGIGTGPTYVKVAKTGSASRVAPVFYELAELKRWNSTRRTPG